MSKIEYPTLDLFIYNLADDSSNTQDYWSNLAEQLKQLEPKKFPTEPNKDDRQRLDFKDKNPTTFDGSYSLANFDDTNCLRYSCSFDRQVELSNIERILTKIKDLNRLPEIGNLAPGKLSENGYLGQTWMISGWTVPANNLIPEANAHQAYKAIIPQGHQHQNLGEFLGATVYEMWRGKERWDEIEKDSHVIVVFYPDEATFQEACKFYNSWKYLFYCRHKILWAYEQGRELKLRLLEKYKHSLIDQDSLESLSNKGLQELKSELQKNINTIFNYVRDINLLQTQQHTVEVNERNYENSRQKKFSNIKFLEDFSKIVKDKYQVQLEKDYLGLNPGLAILENLTATIRGMVEIEQAQRDRNFNTNIAIVGIGLATSQIASSVILAQQPPPKDILFYQTQAFWYSIGTGAIASLVFWIILTKILPRLRR
ncbi:MULTISPECIES: hypothetical protein [unclassified Nostoc]|uniref:hypothetical protein n=1 Tax=unclassified Nostoc TaxID=2593658 RepID=UPI002AD4FFB9|nr:hypothetical protein [Nostoc sp. DedQUE03]MDZ7977290.1 hypothetical protein [Nostoc sp. DedQUE03]MDZ8046331.1 hypothetical protein [Nostoc sp. DedQUE02]